MADRIKSLRNILTKALKKKVKSGSGGGAKGPNDRDRRVMKLLSFVVPHINFTSITVSSMSV